MSAPSVGNSKGKAYEAWLMLEIASQLSCNGFSVDPCGCDNNLITNFSVSGSPVDMPAEADDPSTKPCYFKISKDKSILELHLGLNNKGASLATHEIDLLVIHSKYGMALRKAGGGSVENDLVVALELKAYDEKSKLPHDIPRAFLGVLLDIDFIWFLNRWIKKVFGRRPYKNKVKYAAVLSTANFFDNSKQLLKEHGVAAMYHVSPFTKGKIEAVNIICRSIDRYK